MQKAYLQDLPIETIYFGGGTPSLLTAEEIQQLTETIAQNYKVDSLKEFTLEANPDDLTNKYLSELRHTAVNRLSIGVQSFHDSDLQYMRRAHNSSEAEYAIKNAQDKGFENLTVDLIYGTPGLTDPKWLFNLQQIHLLQIPHCSAYALTVEDGTLLHHDILKKKSEPVDPEQAAAQFEILMDWAANQGYEHYEISNLARPGHLAVHNTAYWQGVPYLGIGPSAHSFNGQTRKWNIANNALYTRNILQHGILLDEVEHLTEEQRLNEYIMTSLRTKWGCDLEKIKREWNSEFVAKIEEQAKGYLNSNWMIQKDKVFTLTNTGKLFADRIASDLFV